MSTGPARDRFVLTLVGPTLILAGCGRLSTPAADHATGADGEPRIVEVLAHDDDFEPFVVGAPAGTAVTLHVTNVGDRPHDMITLRPERRIRTLQPRERGDLTVVVGNDPVTFSCSLHPGMTGQVRATPSPAG